MKKLFALVLTLALVFAIAAPAMAATWGAPTAPTGTPFGTSVTLLQQATDASGTPYYTAYPANLGVVAGTTVLFQVSFTVPTKAQHDAYYAVEANSALSAYATVKNLKDVKEVGTSGIAAIDEDEITFTLPAPGAAAVTKSAIFTAVVTKTAEASITSNYGYDVATTVASFTNIKSGDYTITSSTITDGDNTLTLLLNETNGLVKGMKLSIKGDSKVYTVGNGPVFQYTSGEDVVTVTDATTVAALLAAYNELTDVLGFKVGATGIYFTVANILANFGYKNAATDTKAYKPYTSSLTVSDGTTVPNTGDAVSVLGFVMVGLALLATAAVVVKKVRA